LPGFAGSFLVIVVFMVLPSRGPRPGRQSRSPIG
jgi:hypothetical protein